MAIEGVVADPGTGGAEFGVDEVAGGSGTVAIPYTKLMSGTDADAEVIPGTAANGLDVDVTRSALPTGASTSAKQDTANTSLASIDGKITAVNTGAVVVASGSITANAGTNLNTSALALEAGGNLAAAATSLAVMDDWDESDRAKVNVIVGQAGIAAGTGVDGVTVPRVTLATNVALPAGTNGIGKLTANSGVTIGAVELAAAQTLATVTTVSTVTAVTTLTGSGIAHDGVDSGNPHKIGAKAESSTAGITLVADADRTDLYADLDGILITKNGTAWGDLLSERVSNTDGASTAFSTFGATASSKNMITAITVHNAHATTNGYVDIRDGTAGAVIWTIPLPATGGAVLHFNPPLKQPTANTALAFDVSAAITTIYISVNGFKSKIT